MLLGLVAGTLLAAMLGQMNMAGVADGPLLSFPTVLPFGMPKFDLAATVPLLIFWPTDTSSLAQWQKYRKLTVSGVWPASSCTQTYQPHSHVRLLWSVTMRAVTTVPRMAFRLPSAAV